MYLLHLEILIVGGRVGPYSTTVKLKSRYHDSCENRRLVQKGSFMVRKTPSTDWSFEAILVEGICCKDYVLLSKLNGNVGGECNLVTTLPGSS